jgi:hypothetical protein
VTSASEGLSEAQLEEQPDAGKILVLEVDVPGQLEHRAVL